MESTITRLLVATKALLEGALARGNARGTQADTEGAGLAQWSKGEATEDNISAIYVKLGNDFNVACAAFAKEGIMMTCVAMLSFALSRSLTTTCAVSSSLSQPTSAPASSSAFPTPLLKLLSNATSPKYDKLLSGF